MGKRVEDAWINLRIFCGRISRFIGDGRQNSGGDLRDGLRESHAILDRENSDGFGNFLGAFPDRDPFGFGEFVDGLIHQKADRMSQGFHLLAVALPADLRLLFRLFGVESFLILATLIFQFLESRFLFLVPFDRHFLSPFDLSMGILASPNRSSQKPKGKQCRPSEERLIGFD